MYHRVLNILIAAEDQQLEMFLREIAPVERFSHEFSRHPDIDEADLKGYGVIIIDFDNEKQISQEKIRAAKDKQAILVGCFTADKVSCLADNYHLFDQIWIKPFDEDKVRSSFTGILKRLKEKEDSVLTQKYLDTMIDSLPDLIWFKDAKGAHLKINDSFCKAVNKSKAQIEGRGHYYIWDIEPEEYAQGEYVCLESEEVVINKKVTCLFDETVKCGDELRKFKTYKSPIFDTDGSVIGTVGLARDVTDLQNLIIELNILIESLPFAVLISDKKRKITSVNQRFLDIFLVEREALIGMPIDTLFDETKLLNQDQRWIVEPEEGCIKHASGKRVLKIKEEKLLDIFGKLDSYTQIFIDITHEYRQLEEKKKLEQALEEIKKLSGLLPICASCKKIRDDNGYWSNVEHYIEEHSEAEFSHSMCPECNEQLYGDQEWYKKRLAEQKADDGNGDGS